MTELQHDTVSVQGWADGWNGQTRWKGYVWTGQDWQREVQVQAQVPSLITAKAQYVSGMTTGQHMAWAIATLLSCGVAAPFWVLFAFLGRRRIS